MDQPGQRTPAPGGLTLVQAFLNTADLEAGTDDLGDPGAATVWLQGHAVSPQSPLGDADRARLVAAREALRDVLTVHAGGPPDPIAAERLDGLLGAALLRPSATPQGVRLVPAAGGVDGFLAEIGAHIADATVAGTWERLKVCRDDVCRWAFYDASKNSRGAWCTMRVCGNRAKARAYRERQRAQAHLS